MLNYFCKSLFERVYVEIEGAAIKNFTIHGNMADYAGFCNITGLRAQF
jgi:hypothetical protein